MILSRDQLLTPGADDVDKVDVRGGQVVVRGVTRRQAIIIRAAGDAPEEQEPLILHYGLVDPPLSIEDAAAWIDMAPAGDVQRVVQAVAALSGMEDTAPKRATKSVPRRRRS